MIRAVVFLAFCATVFAGGDDEEEDKFDKWDGIGLGVSIGVLFLAAAFLYVKEFILCPPDDILDEEELSKAVDVGAPNPEAVDRRFMELFTELDKDKSYTISADELVDLVGSEDRAREILRKFDLDKSGDLSVFELQKFYQNDPEQAREDLKKLRTNREKDKGTIGDTAGHTAVLHNVSLDVHEDDLKRDPTGSRKSSMGDPTKIRKQSLGGKELDYSDEELNEFAEPMGEEA